MTAPVMQASPKVQSRSGLSASITVRSGRGLSVEMSVKHGPVTLLSVVEDQVHGFKLLIAEGTSTPGPVLEIGNTNSRYSFAVGARGFIEQWNEQAPAHHCAIGTGHRSADLKKAARLLKIPAVQIC